MTTLSRWMLLVIISILSAACSGGGGGGGSSTPPNPPATKILSGTAAAGTPIAGKVNVKGSNGKYATSPIGIDGSFSLDVSDLTAPYILFAEGSVNGKSIKIYSVAVTEGTINITQVTDFIVRNALAGPAETAYDSWGTTTVTGTALTTAAADVATMLDPLLSALNESGANLLTTPFAADSTGLDAALDAIDISYNGTTATVTNNLTGSSFTDDITASGVVGSLPAADTAATTTVLSDLDGIDAAWQLLVDLYATQLPSASELDPWFTDHVDNDFLEDGLGKVEVFDAWISSGNGPQIGFNITPAIEKPLTISNNKAYLVRFLITIGAESGTFSSIMVYDGANWRWYGNQAWVEASVDTHAFSWVSASSSPTYETGYEFSIQDRNNYAYDNGVRSAVITGPGLPAGGIVYAHLLDITAENEFGAYHSDGSTGGSFYAIGSTDLPNDSAVSSIPDNAEYTFTLCTQTPDVLVSDTSLCSNEFSVTRSVMKPPLPISSLDPSDFAVLTSPASHSLSDFHIGTVFNVSWTKPADTHSGEVGLSIDSTWISSEPGPDDTSTSLDTIGISAPSFFAGLFIRVEDMWGRDFNLGWEIYTSTPAPPEATVGPLDGTWKTACIDVSSNTATGSAQWTEINSGNNFSDTIEIYDNATCTGTPIATKSGSGTSVLGDTLITSTYGYTARRLDWTVTSSDHTGVINAVTDLVADYSVGTTYYDIVLLQGDTIYYGDYTTGDALSSVSRPTEVDLSFGFVKQQ